MIAHLSTRRRRLDVVPALPGRVSLWPRSSRSPWPAPPCLQRHRAPFRRALRRPASVAGCAAPRQADRADQDVDEVFKPIVAGVVQKTRDMFLQTNFMYQKDIDEVAQTSASNLRRA